MVILLSMNSPCENINFVYGSTKRSMGELNDGGCAKDAQAQQDKGFGDTGYSVLWDRLEPDELESQQGRK